MLLYIHYRIGHLCYHRSNDFLQLWIIMTIVSITYILVARPYKKQYGLYNNLDAILLLSILGVFFWWSHTVMTGLCYFMIHLSLYWLFYSFSSTCLLHCICVQTTCSNFQIIASVVAQMTNSVMLLCILGAENLGQREYK